MLGGLDKDDNEFKLREIKPVNVDDVENIRLIRLVFCCMRCWKCGWMNIFCPYIQFMLNHQISVLNIILPRP